MGLENLVTQPYRAEWSNNESFKPLPQNKQSTAEKKPIDNTAQRAIAKTLANLGLPLISHFLKADEKGVSRLPRLAGALEVVSENFSLPDVSETKIGLKTTGLSTEQADLQKNLVTVTDSKKSSIGRDLTRTARNAATQEHCISIILHSKNSKAINAVRELIKLKALTLNRLNLYTPSQKKDIKNFINQIKGEEAEKSGLSV